ncbi:MAG: hypothetical protein RR338_05505, partial [Clostridia bacterium]
SIQDVTKSGNVFIAYKVGGKEFNKGIVGNGNTLPEEDGGPYVVIRTSDSFSNNRVKLLVSVTVQ